MYMLYMHFTSDQGNISNIIIEIASYFLVY